MSLALPAERHGFETATVTCKQQLGPDVYRVVLAPLRPIHFKPGQHIVLRRRDGVARYYSLANLDETGHRLEVHVKRVPNGVLSTWICDSLEQGDVIRIMGPFGSCTYRDTPPNTPLLFIGSGSGIAPLSGVIRDALEHGHFGPIHVYHGSRNASGLYLHDELRALAAAFPNVRYHACVSRDDALPTYRSGRALTCAAADHSRLTGWRVYLCGHAQMVRDASVWAIESGAAADCVLADPFEGVALPKAATAIADPEYNEEPRRPPSPDPEMWQALGRGTLLRQILSDFYARVYRDPLLSPFFVHTTMQRAIEKQYNFLYEIFTGEDVYFGERPRNAHHWMVISDELFDHRERLMRDVLRAHGLPERLVHRWMAMEESYREYIVKDRAWPKITAGEALRLDGYEALRLEYSSLCDGCGDELNVGDVIQLHVRLGSAYCNRCASQANRTARQ